MHGHMNIKLWTVILAFLYLIARPWTYSMDRDKQWHIILCSIHLPIPQYTSTSPQYLFKLVCRSS